jgi:aminoglycoside phosphotransferase (APT) family kinase protein
VHKLLKHLESVGFKYSPRVLGFDNEGREILSFIDGDSGKDGWTKIITDEGLRKYARLLREYHNAVSEYHPANNSEWAYSRGGVKKGEIVCHGDFGVWNIVWRNDEPVGVVDWDFALPAKPRYDVLYALEYSAPFRDDETSIKWQYFPKAPDRKNRIKVFAEAYGLKELGDIVGDVASLQRTVGKYEEYLADRGLQPQADWVANGDLEKIEKRAEWTEANRHLFE